MKPLVLSAALAAALAGSAAAQQQVLQERLDLAALARIRDEGTNRSYLDSMAQQLLDGIGSRLTGSTGLRRAQQWAAETMRGWGLANVQIEPWDSLFGRGWERVSFSGRMVEPVVQPLRAEPAAWSGSTRGAVTCPVILLEVTDTTQLAQYRGRLRGACVMYDRWTPVGPEFEPRTRRLSAESLLVWGAREPAPPPQGGPPGGPGPGGNPQFQAQQQFQRAFVQFLRAEQPAVLLRQTSTAWTYGVLRTGGHPDGAIARDSAYEPTPRSSSRRSSTASCGGSRSAACRPGWRSTCRTDG